MTDQPHQRDKLLRLKGLRAAQLPPLDATPEILAPFLISMLQEAAPFIDSVAPKTAPHARDRVWKAKRRKSYPGSAAPVDLYERVVDSGDGPETWACRRSVHRDEMRKGTASWGEFWDGFKERHVEVEAAFTSSVVSADEVLRWDCGSVEAQEAGTTYGAFTLSAAVMRHRIGKPILRDRTFPVLQMTCAAMEGPGSEAADATITSHREQFLVVSVTVDDFLTSPHVSASFRAQHDDAVVATYVSIERIRKLDGDGEVEWLMATASDARGVLPMWVQTRAVGGQVAKDVPNFFAWAARERG